MNKIITFLKTYRHFLSSFVMLALTLISLIAGVFAWFTINSNTNGSGISVDSNNDNVHFRDRIQIKRYYGTNLVNERWFYTDSSTDQKRYYEYDFSTESYVLDSNNQRIDMNITSIFPNEYIDVTMWYYTDTNEATTYNLCLTDFDDTFGQFSETNNNQTYTHSALGVFRVGEVYEEEGQYLVDDNDWSYLCKYNGDYLEDTKYNSVSVKRGNFSTESTTLIGNINYYKATFRIQLKFDQYYQYLPNSSTNALSEKSILIGTIRLIA